jgi:hypothetical protein
MADRRNTELHTGEYAFRDFSNGKWLPDYYRISALITEYLGFKLEDFLGEQEAKVAQETIHKVEAEVKRNVNDQIAKCKRSIEALRPDELARRRAESEPQFQVAHSKTGLAAVAKDCPACGSKGYLSAKPIGSSPARLKDGEIKAERIYAPDRFNCKVCDLALAGVSELSVAELSDQIAFSEILYPVDFFQVDPRD